MSWFDEHPANAAVSNVSFEEAPGSGARAVDFATLHRPTTAETTGLSEGSSFVADPDDEESDGDSSAVREEAFRAGFEQAHAEFESDLRAEQERVQKTLDSVIEELERFDAQFEEAVRALAVPLARVFAENVVGGELSDPDALAQMASDVFGRAASFASINVWAHPNTVATLQRRRGRLRPDDPDGSSITFHDDAELEPGDIRIVADGGTVESIVADRLDRLEEFAAMNLERTALNDEGQDATHE